MNFKDLLIQAKDGSHYVQEKIFSSLPPTAIQGSLCL